MPKKCSKKVRKQIEKSSEKVRKMFGKSLEKFGKCWNISETFRKSSKKNLSKTSRKHWGKQSGKVYFPENSPAVLRFLSYTLLLLNFFERNIWRNFDFMKMFLKSKSLNKLALFERPAWHVMYLQLITAEDFSP